VHDGGRAVLDAPSDQYFCGLALIGQWMRLSSADKIFEGSQRVADEEGSVDVLSSHHLQHCQHWKDAFASQHKDHRYYEIVADTLHSEFRYLYFALRATDSGYSAILYFGPRHPGRSAPLHRPFS
jgi:hypothetical protein